jgi:hypothetical protein
MPDYRESMSVGAPQDLRPAVRRRRDGWRLRITPGGVWSPLVVVVWVVALVLAAALQLVMLAALFVLVGVGETHHQLAFVLVGVPALGLGALATAGGLKLGYAALAFVFRIQRLDFRLDAHPPRIVASGWLRRSVLLAPTLTGVLLREYDSHMEVVLRAGKRTIMCRSTVISPLDLVDLPTLAGWLGEILTPWEVPVRHYRGRWDWTVIEAGWMPAGQVARLWSVSPDDVRRLADRYDIPVVIQHGQPLFDAYAVDEYTEQARQVTDLHGPEPD